MSEEDKAAVRKIALEVIADYRDRGLPGARADRRRTAARDDGNGWSASRCPTSTCRWCSRRWSSTAATRAPAPPLEQAARDRFPVVVIGCGESGLLAGIRLKEAGIPFTIVEKNAGVGGTWYQNTYPGARVDVRNHFYCYSFEPTDQWTQFFAEQPELQAYFERVMDKHDIGRHVRWETEVTEAVVGRRDRDVDRVAPATATATTTRTVGARGDHRGGAARPAAHPDDRGAARLRRTGIPLQRVGSLRRPRRQAGRHDRRGRQRLSDRADDRAGCRAPHRVSAHRAVDVPQPELPRRSRPRCAVGAAASAVLRPLVPLPAVLAVVRQGTRRGARRPGVSGSAEGGQRDQRGHPDHVHRLDHQSGRR